MLLRAPLSWHSRLLQLGRWGLLWPPARGHGGAVSPGLGWAQADPVPAGGAGGSWPSMTVGHADPSPGGHALGAR